VKGELSIRKPSPLGVIRKGEVMSHKPSAESKYILDRAWYELIAKANEPLDLDALVEFEKQEKEIAERYKKRQAV